MDRGFVHECPLPPDHYRVFLSPDSLAQPPLEQTLDLAAKYREKLGLPFGNNTESISPPGEVTVMDFKKALRTLMQNMMDIVCDPVFEGSGFVKTDALRNCTEELNELIVRYRTHQAKEELIHSSQRQLATLLDVEVDLKRYAYGDFMYTTKINHKSNILPS